MLCAMDCDHDLVDVPLVARRRPISPNTICKMPPETIDPKPDCFPADNDTAFGEQVFHIGGAERKAMISPHCIGDDFTGKAKAFQARHLIRGIHPARIAHAERSNNMAIPFDFIAIPKLNKMQLLELARCEWIERRENVIALGC